MYIFSTTTLFILHVHNIHDTIHNTVLLLLFSQLVMSALCDPMDYSTGLLS